MKWPEELMACVLRDSGSDEPRRVLADWLIERGELRGELIALQLAGERRATSLIERHEIDWLGSVAGDGSWRFEWDRGFVSAAKFRLDDGVAGRAAIVEHYGGSGHDVEGWEGTLLGAFLNHPESRLIERAEVQIIDFQRSSSALIEAIAALERPALRTLAIAFRFAALGANASWPTSAGARTVPTPHKREGEGWPLVSAKLVQRFCGVTPDLGMLELAAPGLLDELQHPHLRRLRLVNPLTVTSGGGRGRGLRLPCLEALEIVIDTPIDESPPVDVTTLDLDTARLPRLRDLALLGGVYHAPASSLAAWLCAHPLLLQLDTLTIPSLRNDDDLAAIGRATRHLRELRVERVEDVDFEEARAHIPQLR